MLVELNCVDLLKLCVMLSVALMGLCEKSKSCHGPVVAHGDKKWAPVEAKKLIRMFQKILTLQQ